MAQSAERKGAKRSGASPKGTQRLKNKKILITAGPTWVPIDSVRVISNIATGETGRLLAERLASLGAKVTLVIGQGSACCINKAIRVVRFMFFEDLKDILQREIRRHRYHALIHSAAVSDYQVAKIAKGKIPSGNRKLLLRLKPTQKLINKIKKIDPDIFLVGFKYEPQVKKSELLHKADQLLKATGSDLVVANTLSGKRYRAYIIRPQGTSGPYNHKAGVVGRLTKELLQ